MKEFVNKYLDENPQDEMIFKEVMDRANLSKEERYVFWNAVKRFTNVIFIQSLYTNMQEFARHIQLTASILNRLTYLISDKPEEQQCE